MTKLSVKLQDKIVRDAEAIEGYCRVLEDEVRDETPSWGVIRTCIVEMVDAFEHLVTTADKAVPVYWKDEDEDDDPE